MSDALFFDSARSSCYPESKQERNPPRKRLLAAKEGRGSRGKKVSEMSLYLIKSPHTVENCLEALDEEAAKGPAILEKFVYGCSEGDHTGYAITEAKDKKDALGLVPEFIRKDAWVVKVDRFTPEIIKSFHVKAA